MTVMPPWFLWAVNDTGTYRGGPIIAATEALSCNAKALYRYWVLVASMRLAIFDSNTGASFRFAS